MPERLEAARRRLSLRKVGESHVLLLEPLAVGTARGDLELGLFIRDDPPAVEVDEKQLAGL